MRKTVLSCQACIMLLLFLVALPGCSTTKSVVKKIAPTKDSIKKQLMITPLVDQAGLGPTRTAQIHMRFVELLQRSPQILVFQDTLGIRVPKRSKPIESGIRPSPELIEKSLDMGMNAILIGILNPLEVTTGKTGIWPFRDMSTIVEISMLVNVFDTTSGCLYLTQLESEEMPFLFDELQGRDENEIIDQILQEKMLPLLERQAEAVIDHLTDETWTGKILAVENGTVKISGGKNVGIHPGQVFAVYALGESIICGTGKPLALLGEKIGEIRTTQIMADHSLAVPLAEAPLLAGQIVKSAH